MRGRDTADWSVSDSDQVHDAQQSGDRNQNKYPGSQNEENRSDKNDNKQRFMDSLNGVDTRTAEMLGWKPDRAGEESKNSKDYNNREKLSDLPDWDRRNTVENFVEAFKNADFEEWQLKEASMDVATTIFDNSYGKAEKFQAENDEKYPKTVYDVLKEEGIKDIQIDKEGVMYFEYKDAEQFKRIAQKTEKTGVHRKGILPGRHEGKEPQEGDHGSA